MIRLATINGRRVQVEPRNEIARETGADRAQVRRARDKLGGDFSPPSSYARLADCTGNLFTAYQEAKAAWDVSRGWDDPDRERLRLAAINAYNAWALSCGMAPIIAPSTWGFN